MSDTIEITRQNLGNNLQNQKSDSIFPTEIINLPSKGWFYSSENPLSSGTLEIKMMTAHEEDILTSKNLIQKNIVLDKLLESIVVNKNIDLTSMLTCDRNAIFFAIRRLAYGDKYDATITCGRCEKENNISIDLSTIDNREFEFEKYTRGQNSFEFKLPYSKVTVNFKLLTKKDEIEIEKEVQGLSKITKDFSREVTTRLSHIITSINGDDKRTTIRQFVNDKLVSRDSLALRSYIRDSMPDINSKFNFSCVHCGLERKEEIPMGISFFWPDR